jgi:hypothetical protein
MVERARIARMADGGAAPRRLAEATARTTADTRHSMVGNCVRARRPSVMSEFFTIYLAH